MRNLPYLIGQGLKGIVRHKAASLFSLLIMVLTIYLFDAAAAVMMNINAFVKDAETNVGVTVFFNEGLTEEQILEIGREIGSHNAVLRMEYTSAEEAWKQYQAIYFAGNEKLAEGYAEDNPLANSASFEYFLKDIDRQQDFVSFVESVPGVRRVNYSSVVAEGLSNIAKVLETGTVIVLVILVVVAVSLISNGIAMTISLRQDEIHIMRYIGATNGFIRGPLLLEGILIGLVGAAIPLLAVWFTYPLITKRLLTDYSNLTAIFRFLDRQEIFRFILPVSLLLGLGIGLLGSLFSIKRHLKV